MPIPRFLLETHSGQSFSVSWISLNEKQFRWPLRAIGTEMPCIAAGFPLLICHKQPLAMPVIEDTQEWLNSWKNQFTPL